MGLRNRADFLDEKCFFVTTTCNKWLKLIDQAQAYSLVLESLQYVNEKYKADILGYVIMPNHLHLILIFKEFNQLSDYMRDFKKFTSTHIRKSLEARGYLKLIEKIRNEEKNRMFQVWQNRFDDLYLDNIKLLETKLEYIHLNPLQEQWDLVKQPEDYPYSSALFYEKGQQRDFHVVHYLDYF